MAACVALCDKPWFVNGYAGGLYNGMTPLGVAARSGCDEGVLTLLRANADPNKVAKNTGKAPPIVNAAMNRDPAWQRSARIAEAIIQFGGRPSICDATGRSAFHYAAKHSNLPLLGVLLRYDAKADEKDEQHFTPALLAAKFGHVEVFKELVSRGADVDATDKNGFNALMHAASNGRLHVVKEAIRIGIDVNLTPYRHGPTALAIAAREGHARVMEVLCDAGANLSAKGGASLCTVLHEAADAANVEGVRLLVERGACVHTKDAEGKTALHRAAVRQSTEIIDILLEHGADPSVYSDSDVSPAMYAAHYNCVAALEILEEGGADLLAVTAEGDTALAWAAVGNAPAATAYLLKRGAAPNILDDFGGSPLHHAVENESVENVRLLLKHGADPNMLNSIAETPLHEAVRRCPGKAAIRVLGHLLAAGAKPNATTRGVLSPYRTAIALRQYAAVQALACYGGRAAVKAAPPKSKIGMFLAAVHNRHPPEIRFMLNPPVRVSRPSAVKNFSKCAGLNIRSAMSTWISARRKPVIPRALRAASQPSGTLTPRLRRGPSPKLSVRRRKAARAVALSRMNIGNSAHGTGPATWYRMAA